MVLIDLSASSIFQYRTLANSGTMGKVNHMINDFSEEVLILGSSRALHHYNSNIFLDSLNLSTYNGAYDGNGIILAKGLTDIAFKNHKPKLIIYELTPGFDLMKNDNIQYLSRLKPYYNYEEIENLFEIISPLEALKMKSNLYRLNSYLFGFLGNVLKSSTTNDTLKGFLPNYGIMKYDPQFRNQSHFEIDTVKLSIFNTFLENLKQQNIPIVFTISPVHSYPDTIAYDSIKKIMQNKGYRVFDHLYDEKFIGKNKFFEDRTHLNYVGADSISKVIVHQLIDSIN